MRVVGLLSQQTDSETTFARRLRRRLGRLFEQPSRAKCGMRCGACCGECLTTRTSNSSVIGRRRRARATAIRGGICLPCVSKSRSPVGRRRRPPASRSFMSACGAFLRDAHAIAARNGMVDMNLLLVDGRPAAFAYNYHFHGRLTAVRFGYDASLGRQGLGTALALRSIEDSFERGDVSLDLGPGETRFQRRLRTRSEASYRMTYVPLGSWRSQVVRFSRWAKRNRAAATIWEGGFGEQASLPSWAGRPKARSRGSSGARHVGCRPPILPRFRRCGSAVGMNPVVRCCSRSP